MHQSLKDVDEKELFLNHGGHSTKGRLLTVGLGTLPIVAWLLQSPSAAWKYITTNAWFSLIALLSYLLLVGAETLQLEFSNYYLLDGKQYFDQQAMGKRRLLRRLLRLPMLLVVLYFIYMLSPWAIFAGEQGELPPYVRWVGVVALAGLIYYLVNGYYAGFEALYTARKYGHFVATFDKEKYHAGDAVNLRARSERGTPQAGETFDLVVQKVFEHKWVEHREDSDGNDRTTHHHERKIHYCRHFEVSAEELAGGFCFDLPDDINGLPMGTTFENIKEMHYWEVLVDKQKSPLWGRFLFFVYPAVENGLIAKGNEVNTLLASGGPALDRKPIDAGHKANRKELEVKGSSNGVKAFLAFFPALFLGIIIAETIDDPTQWIIFPVSPLNYIMYALMGLLAWPVVLTVASFFRYRPSLGREQATARYYRDLIMRTLTALCLLPVFSFALRCVYHIIFSYQDAEVWGPDQVGGEALPWVFAGVALLFISFFTGRHLYRTVRSWGEFVFQNPPLGVFDQETYRPGEAVNFRLEDARGASYKHPVRVSLRLIDESMDEHIDTRYVVYADAVNVTTAELAKGINLRLPAALRGFDLTSNHRNWQAARYWEVVVEYPAYQQFRQFFLRVAGDPVETVLNVKQGTERAEEPTRPVADASDPEINWF